MVKLEKLIKDLETTEFIEWYNLTREISEFGKNITEFLCKELINSIGKLETPYVILQKNPIVSPEEYKRILNVFSNQNFDSLEANNALIINVRFRNLIAERGSFIQNTRGYNLIYAGRKSEIRMTTAEEIWVARDRKVSYTTAKYIFAGFPKPEHLPKDVFYETKNPTDCIIATGYNRALGIIEALRKIKDNRAIPWLQNLSKEIKNKSYLVYNAAIESIEELKGFNNNYL